MADTDEPLPLIRRILPFLSVALIIAALYVAYTFYSRWSRDRDAQQAAESHQTEEARKTVDLLGGGKFKILSFYAVPGVIKRGEHTTVCFGVSGTKAVRTEPEIEPLKPSLSRCMQVSPRKDSEYKLIAEDGNGHTVTEHLTIKVVP